MGEDIKGVEICVMCEKDATVGFPFTILNPENGTHLYCILKIKTYYISFPLNIEWSGI
jgi:hypothetical protein